jgi:transcriptional regulator with XRE-family HTH domain
MDTTKETGDLFSALLGAELKGAITARGLTANEVAEKVGIERATMNRYLNGKRVIPSSTFAMSAAAIGIEPGELVDRAYNRLKESIQ